MSDDLNNSEDAPQQELATSTQPEVVDQAEKLFPQYSDSRNPLEGFSSENVESIFVYGEEHTMEISESEVDSLIPSEHKLAGIEKYVPGGAARFLDLVEENGKHRRQETTANGIHERRMNAGRLARSFSGLGAGLIVTLYCLYLSGSLIMAGHDVAGGVLGSVDLVALTTVFVVGSKTVSKNQPKEKDESSDEAED